MTTCAICHHAIEGPGLADEATGTAVHAACAAERAPGDLVVAVLALVASVLAPAVVVWAG